MIKKYFLFISLFVLQLSIYAQIDRTRSWVFGQGIGIYFNKSGSIDTIPGIFTPLEPHYSTTGVYNDSNGNPLLYSLAGTIINKNNKPLNDYTKIYLGGSSATSQSTIITSLNDSIFHIFGLFRNSAYFYSNFNQIKKEFSVIQKPIISNVCQSQALVNHQNGKWQWVVCHSLLGDTIYSFLINEYGLVESPVINTGGPFFKEVADGQGCFKFMASGKILAFTSPFDGKITFFSFDNQTGLVKPLFYSIIYGLPWGLEFYNNKLLFTEWANSKVWESSLDKMDSLSVAQSRRLVWDSSGCYKSQLLQLAPDGNIYMTLNQEHRLAKLSLQSNNQFKFEYTAPILGKKYCYYGFPNFNASYFYRPAVNFTYSQNCKNNQFHFLASDTFQATSYFWKFTLNNKQYSDTQYGKSINYTFSDSGIWQVILIAQKGSRSDTMIKNIRIQAPLTSGFLGNDILIPAKSPISGTILAPTPLHCAHWRKINDTTEVTQNQFQFNDTGSIICQLTNAVFCVYTDTISIRVCDSFANMAHIDKSNDTLFTKTYAYKYQWFKNDSAIANSNNPWLKIQTDGQYTLRTYNQQNCDSLSKKFLVVGLNTASVKPNNAISIKPNPNNGSFTLNSQLSPIQSVEIFDLSGRLVFSNSSNSTDHQLNFHLPLQSGIYCLRINQTNYQLIQILNN